MDAERNWSQAESLAHLCMEHGVKTFAEIGVFHGGTAFALLCDQRLAFTRYYMIDPWVPYIDQQDFIGMGIKTQEQFDIIFEHVLMLAMFHADRAEVMRMTSAEAAFKFADASLDCVFIDGNHKRMDVQADIDRWLPKVKIGGVLAGHDYNVLADVNDAVHSRFSVEQLGFLPDNQFAVPVPDRSLDLGWDKAIWYYVKP